jgi:hypothetical protein
MKVCIWPPKPTLVLTVGLTLTLTVTGADKMVREKGALATAGPPSPAFTVMEYVPGVARLPTAKVMLPVFPVPGGVNCGATPAGTPLKPRFTGFVSPGSLCTITVIVGVALFRGVVAALDEREIAIE